MSKTAVGLFRNSGVADQVVHDLDASGFPRNEVRRLGEDRDMGDTGMMGTPHTDFAVGLDRELRRIGASDPEAHAYVQGVRRGGVLVFATGSDEQVDSAAEIMNRHGAAEVEELTGREPNTGRIGGEGMPLVQSDFSQTGRVRQQGGGARMFVW
jgi:hypothetical protein